MHKLLYSLFPKERGESDPCDYSSQVGTWQVWPQGSGIVEDTRAQEKPGLSKRGTFHAGRAHPCPLCPSPGGPLSLPLCPSFFPRSAESPCSFDYPPYKDSSRLQLPLQVCRPSGLVGLPPSPLPFPHLGQAKEVPAQAC